jgi:hypothetical protein
MYSGSLLPVYSRYLLHVSAPPGSTCIVGLFYLYGRSLLLV